MTNQLKKLYQCFSGAKRLYVSSYKTQFKSSKNAIVACASLQYAVVDWHVKASQLLIFEPCLLQCLTQHLDALPAPYDTTLCWLGITTSIKSLKTKKVKNTNPSVSLPGDHLSPYNPFLEPHAVAGCTLRYPVLQLTAHKTEVDVI